MLAQQYDISIEQGKYVRTVLRWAAQKFIYKPITAIERSAPVRVTAVGHGLTSGWPAAVVSVKGMTEINAPTIEGTTQPTLASFVPVSVVDADTVEFNHINAADYSTYVSGGYLQYYEPVSLTGYSARMQARDRMTGELLFELTTSNGGIEIDDAACTVTLVFVETHTAGDEWRAADYDLELVDADGRAYPMVKGLLLLSREVTV